MESENRRVVRRRVKIRTVEKRPVKKSFFNKRIKFGKNSSLYYREAIILVSVFLIVFFGLVFLWVTAFWDNYALPTNSKPRPKVKQVF